jgi:hypothetical protein
LDDREERRLEWKRNTALSDGPTGILILGMHRSGTSAVARVVNLLGAELGSKLLKPFYGNEKGFWELQEAMAIHDRLLARFGSSWDDVRRLPEGWRKHPATLRAEAEIGELVASEFGASPLWASKDPRLCRLAPLWLRALEKCGQTPVALLVLRHPREVAESLLVRDGIAPARSYVLWLRHFLEAERATRGVRRTVVSYDELLDDWSACMQRVARELDVSWPRSYEEAAPEIAPYLDRGEKHYSADALPRVKASERDVPPALMRLYEAGLEAARSNAGWDAIVGIAAEMVPVAELFDGAIDDLGRRLKEQEERAAATETWLTVARPALEGAVEQARQRLGEVEAAVHQRDAEKADLGAKLDATVLDWRDSRAEAAELAKRLSVLEDILRAAETRLAAAGAELREKDQSLATAWAALRDKEQLLAVVETECRTKEQTLAATEAELRVKEQFLADAQYRRDELQARLDSAIASRESENAALTLSLKRCQDELEALQRTVQSRRWLVAQLLLQIRR